MKSIKANSAVVVSCGLSCQSFSQMFLTFKKSVESNEEKLDGGEAVVALSSQGSPAQQREGETEGDHLAVLT